MERGMDRIDLTRDRERWQVIVKVVMKLRVQENAANFLTS